MLEDFLYGFPEQVRIIHIADDHNEYAINVEKQLKSNDIRTKTDIKPGKLNGKIKNAQLENTIYGHN